MPEPSDRALQLATVLNMVGATGSPFDPSLFLSTVAVASAALIAIIGGLLVSRLVTLSTERQGLLRRIEELRSEQGIVNDNYEEAARIVRLDAYGIFFDHVLEDYVAHRGSPPDEVGDFPALGSDDEERSQWRALLGQLVRDAFEVVERSLLPDEITVTVTQLADRGVDVEAFPQDLLERVIEQIGTERRPKSGLGALARSDSRAFRAVSMSPRIAAPFERQERMTRIGERDSLRARAVALDAEIKLIDGQVKRLVPPSGVGLGIGALGTFALLGIVFPLALMAQSSISTGIVWRVLVIAAFVGGLGLVLAFITWQWQELRSPSK